MRGYVYLLGSSEYGWYKIGKSRRPSVRAKELGILLPFEIRPIAIWESERYSALERELHEKFADDRINGEWFKFEIEHIEVLFDHLSIYRRVFPAVIPSLSLYLIKQVPKGAATRSAQSKQLSKLFYDRMNELLQLRGLEPTAANRKLVRQEVVNALQTDRSTSQLSTRS